MGAVNTTYTFTATDTITSAKMNNIIDETTITSDAIFGGTLEVAAGKLKVRSQGITSNELANNAVNTLALADAAVTPAKLSLNGPSWNEYTTSTFGDRLLMMSRNVVNGSTGLEIGQGNTIDQYTFVDFHATATGGLYPTDGDANARIAREQGLNGAFQFLNSGTGQMSFSQAQAGAFAFDSSGSNRMFIGDTGIVNIPNALSVGPGSSLVDRITSNGPIFIYPGTTNSYAGVVELANRTNTYLGFAGAGGTSDWAYLRQVSSDGIGANDYTLAFDLHDDANDPSGGQAFAIRQVGSSTSPDTITTNFIVDKNGNVGIGTDTPINFGSGYKTIQVRGTTSGAVIRLQSDNVTGDVYSDTSAFVMRTGTDHPIIFATNGIEKTRLTTNGNFGIGTTNPNAKLDVNGNAYVNENINAGGSLGVGYNVYAGTVGTGGLGFVLGDDGDMVDLNDGYCAMRFSQGVRIHSGNKTGSPVITLASNGIVTATSFSGNLTGTASAVADGAISAPKLNGNQSGAAPIFGIRAWVTFNGTNGAVTIIEDGNVASVTRVGVGLYDIVFSQAMPSANYAVMGTGKRELVTGRGTCIDVDHTAAKTTTAVRIRAFQVSDSPSPIDVAQVYVAFIG